MANKGRAVVDSMRRRLAAAFTRASDPKLDSHAQADLAGYLCVRTSGYVERAFVELLSALSETKCDPRVAQYVSSKLDRTTNLGVEKLVKALGEFDAKWAVRMSAFFANDEEAREALNSIVAKRHRIAHGHDDGTSLLKIRSWFSAVDRAVKELEEIIDPSTTGKA